MMEFSIPTAMAITSIISFIIAVFMVLIPVESDSNMTISSYRLLASGYICNGLRVIAQLMVLGGHRHLFIISDLLYIGFVSCIWLGVRSYINPRPFHARLLALPILMVLWVFVARSVDMRLPWLALPDHMAGAVLFGLSGHHFWKLHQDQENKELLILGILLWLQGLSTITYPFNRMTWWAPYGFSTLAFLGTAIGLGLMVAALREKQRWLNKEKTFTRALLDNQIEGVVACDENGDLVLFNRTLAKWQGMDALKLPKEQWAEHYDLFEADGTTPLETHAIPLVRTFNGEVIHDIGLVICAKNQPPRHVLCNGSPILDEMNRKLGAVVVLHDITKQRHDSERLQDTVQRMELATTSSRIGVWDWNLQDGTMIWDDRMFELYGATRGEIHGSVQDWKDGLHPEDIDRAVAECEAAIRGEAQFDTDFRVQQKNGAVLWIHANATVIRDATGRPLRMIGLNRDITERKHGEAQLQERERLLGLFIQNAPAAIAMLDLDMRYIFASRRWFQDYRLESQDIIGRSHYEVFPEIPDRWKEIHRRCLAGATESCEEDPFPRSDGLLDWVKWSIRPWLNSSNQIGGIIIMSEMVTQRKLAEDAVRKISVAVEQSPVTVVITDVQGRIEYVNPKFTEVTGYAAAEAIGQNPRILKSGHFSSENYRDLWATITNGKTWEGEFHNKKKNGVLFWEAATIAPIKDSFGKIINFVAIKEDITEFKRVEAERKVAEAEVRRLNEDLEQRVKDRTTQLEAANKEMEAFSYSVSHDLRAPLRSIDGFSQVLLEDYPDRLDEEGKRYLTRIRLGTQRMGHLIDDLLKLSKTSRAELTTSECDLSSLCCRVAGNLAELNPERRVKVTIQPGMLVQADLRLMQVVLENLLGNAWKFTSRQRDPRVEAGEMAGPDGKRTFFIRDNGAGFDMAFVGKLFNAFQRLHATSEFEGTGIGLAIVQRIIHRHGGRVWAEAEMGKGATFFFTLPG